MSASADASALVDLKNKRLVEIRDAYKEHLKTPQQRKEDSKREKAAFLQQFPMLAASMAQIDSLVGEEGGEGDDEDPRNKIHSATFDLRNRGRITITSEGSRHWRIATVCDVSSIVFDGESFGDFDDLDEESDEEFPDTKHPTAVVYYFDGKHENPPWAYDNKFDEFKIVPDGVLNGVRDEAPPGRFFSGKSTTGGSQTWSPAPEGKVWVEHPFLTNPNGAYLSDEHAFYTLKWIECPGIRPDILQKAWKEEGALAYWCPVLKRFLTEGERLRQQHWFHNGDGSAQQRYFYDQNEMLDMHGGLGNLPAAISGGEEVVCMGVRGFVDIDEDTKMPAKK